MQSALSQTWEAIGDLETRQFFPIALLLPKLFITEKYARVGDMKENISTEAV